MYSSTKSNNSSNDLPKSQHASCTPVSKRVLQDTAEAEFQERTPDLLVRSSTSSSSSVFTWEENESMDYQIISKIGSGSFSEVYKARDGRTKELVAIKQINLAYSLREVNMLSKIKHPNIVNLIVAIGETEEDPSKCLIFEYMDHDLRGLLESGMVNFSNQNIANIVKQLFMAVAYCHKRNIIHRDIKSSNILLNNRGEVKLADFGLARYYYPKKPHRKYTNQVITLLYRPPELVLGERCYDTSVDVWSCGCVMAELFTLSPFFDAKSEIEYLDTVFQICGSPVPAVWPNVIKLPLFHTLQSKQKYPRVLRCVLGFVPILALDLIDQLLVLDPQKRITMKTALESPYLCNVDPAAMPKIRLPTGQDCHELRSENLQEQQKSAASNFSEMSLEEAFHHDFEFVEVAGGEEYVEEPNATEEMDLQIVAVAGGVDADELIRELDALAQ